MHSFKTNQKFHIPLRRAVSTGGAIGAPRPAEAAAVIIQSVLRGYLVRSRLKLAQQAARCVSTGTMFAFRGTPQVRRVGVMA